MRECVIACVLQSERCGRTGWEIVWWVIWSCVGFNLGLGWFGYGCGYGDDEWVWILWFHELMDMIDLHDWVGVMGIRLWQRERIGMKEMVDRLWTERRDIHISPCMSIYFGRFACSLHVLLITRWRSAALSALNANELYLYWFNFYKTWLCVLCMTKTHDGDTTSMHARETTEAACCMSPVLLTWASKGRGA